MSCTPPPPPPHTSIIQKLVHPPNLLAHVAQVPPGAKRVLQMAARVQHLGPDLLLHVPAELLYHVFCFPPHALAADLVVEHLVHFRRVCFVHVCVQERWPDGRFQFFAAAEDVVVGLPVVVVARVVLHHPRGLELLVVDLRVAECGDGRADGVEGRVQAHGCGEVGLFVRFPVALQHGGALREESVVVRRAVVVVV